MSIEDQIRTAMLPYRAARRTFEPRSGQDGRLEQVGPDTPRSSRSRLLVVLVTAAALVVGTTVALAGVRSFGDHAPDSLQRVVDDLFAGGRCVTQREASTKIGQDLEALGYDEWVIESRPGAVQGACVAAGLVPDLKRVVLVPASGPTVSEALENIRSAMMSECFDEEEATDLIRSTLSGLGQADVTILTDGPLAVPNGQEEAVRTHVASGCYVYSGMGWDANGQPMYFVNGPA
jgi:hypothetical protein